MVRPTKALPVGRVEWSTAVTDLHDMISKHAMPRLSLEAALPMLDCLAAAACSSNDLGTPFPVLRCEIEWVDSFRREPHSPRIERPDRWP
jgi:hypothetical protein